MTEVLLLKSAGQCKQNIDSVRSGSSRHQQAPWYSIILSHFFHVNTIGNLILHLYLSRFRCVLNELWVWMEKYLCVYFLWLHLLPEFYVVTCPTKLLFVSFLKAPFIPRSPLLPLKRVLDKLALWPLFAKCRDSKESHKYIPLSDRKGQLIVQGRQ